LEKPLLQCNSSFVFHFQAGKEVDFHVILLFCRSQSFENNYVNALKEFTLFHEQFLVEKRANSNILLQNQNCFREQVSCVRNFTASKNFFFDQQKYCPDFLFLRDKKN